MPKLSRAKFNAAEEEIRHLKQELAQRDGRIEQLEREKASWQGAYDGAVLALTERNKELEEALREICSIPAQKRGSASHAMLVIAAAALGEKKDE